MRFFLQLQKFMQILLCQRHQNRLNKRSFLWNWCFFMQNHHFQISCLLRRPESVKLRNENNNWTVRSHEEHWQRDKVLHDSTSHGCKTNVKNNAKPLSTPVLFIYGICHCRRFVGVKCEHQVKTQRESGDRLRSFTFHVPQLIINQMRKMLCSSWILFAIKYNLPLHSNRRAWNYNDRKGKSLQETDMLFNYVA